MLHCSWLLSHLNEVVPGLVPATAVAKESMHFALFHISDGI